MRDYRAISMWHDTAGEGDYSPRPSLTGRTQAAVCIVGAGYTGLWTAYYLKKADPTLRVVVLEKEIAGFGASGRNGAWCSQFFASSMQQLAKAGGKGRSRRPAARDVRGRANAPRIFSWSPARCRSRSPRPSP
jgi:glycine/D-amino acid oxidase-like deaminating enzyme